MLTKDLVYKKHLFFSLYGFVPMYIYLQNRIVHQLEVLDYRLQNLDSKAWNSTTLELLALCSQTADRPQHDTHWSILLQSRNYTFSNLWDNLDACM